MSSRLSQKRAILITYLLTYLLCTTKPCPATTVSAGTRTSVHSCSIARFPSNGMSLSTVAMSLANVEQSDLPNSCVAFRPFLCNFLQNICNCHLLSLCCYILCETCRSEPSASLPVSETDWSLSCSTIVLSSCLMFCT